jgi:hypothetical protein
VGFPDAAPDQKTHPGGPDGQGDGTGPSGPWVGSDSTILSLLTGLMLAADKIIYATGSTAIY